MPLGDKGNGIEPTSFEIDHAAFAYFQGAIEAARDGHLSGGLKISNKAMVIVAAASFTYCSDRHRNPRSKTHLSVPRLRFRC